jgi:hypothetical protein
MNLIWKFWSQFDMKILKSIWYHFLQTNAYQKNLISIWSGIFWSNFEMSSENVDFFESNSYQIFYRIYTSNPINNISNVWSGNW